jgi:glycosyltransferase involved in cell wall biosynthesis
VPILATLHLPPAWYPSEIFQMTRPQTFLNCVSRSQLNACPPSNSLLPEIENGVPIPELLPRHAKRSFAIALGRICQEKGFHLAIEAARLANLPLLIAGEIFPYAAHQHYFKSEILPRLDNQRRFIGPIGTRRKKRLLSAARCLLVPSLAPETSSLVAMEALACGTPVIAFSTGALSEIVEHGKTGFLVSNTREMADAIRHADEISPEFCRETAQRRFSAKRMTNEYLRVYCEIISSAVSEFIEPRNTPCAAPAI